MGQLIIPKSGESGTTDVECRALVLVGANGAGKSRFGVVVEQSQAKGVETHRISAQRALKFADQISPKTIDDAKLFIRCGASVKREAGRSEDVFIRQIESHKQHTRWGENPTGHTLNDVDHLFSLLAARERNVHESVFKKHISGDLQRNDFRESPIMLTKRIWKSVMPHRDIDFRDDRIFVAAPATAEYLANQMSDGERVALYLIAQAVCAEPSSVLIIDEPEIHLHKSIQARLWDAIEAARPDCTFVYITHDLDFAASRERADKIWIKEFDGNQWTWELVPDITDISPALAMELLGGRKPVLFVEGTSASIDVQLYRTTYPDHQIVPRGSCQNVIQTTRAIRAAIGMHGMVAYGLIDRDRRSEQEIASLQQEGVFSLPVAEAENLLISSCVIKAASEHNHKDTEEVLKQVTEFVLKEFEKDKERQAADFAKHEAHYQLACFDLNVHDRSSFEMAVREFKNQVDPQEIFDSKIQLLNEAVVESNYEKALAYFNRKGLVNQVSNMTGIEPRYFREWVQQHILTKQGMSLLEDLRIVLPKIPTIQVLPGAGEEKIEEDRWPNVSHSHLSLQSEVALPK